MEDHMSQTRTWEGEEVTIVFEADFELTAYGVPRSPTWWEMTDLRMISVEILGVDLPITSLTPELKTTLESLHEDLDWADAASD
jgi:hypothetical protein